MSDGQIGEEEVASWGGSIEIGHARHRSACQDWEGGLRWCGSTTWGKRTCILQCRKEEEVGIVLEGDVGLDPVCYLEDSEVDDWRRIHWTAIRRCWQGLVLKSCLLHFDFSFALTLTFGTGSTCSRTLRLLDHGHLVHDLAALFGNPRRSGMGLVGNGDQVGGSHAG